MKKTLLHPYYLFLIFLLSSGSTLWSQQFPVTVNTILTTPALPHLESFISDNPTAVMVNVILTDPTTTEFDVGLRMTISGQGIHLTTDPLFFGEIYTLSSNVPLILTGSDLAQYFNPGNLLFSGITQEQYLNNGQLPEGFYSICFEAYDINAPNSLPISNKACGIGVIEEFDPPMIINPLGESPYQETQHYIFSWQALHPAGFDVDYYLEIYEKVEGVSDAGILQYESPIAEITTTNFTSYVYSLVDPVLEKEMDYLMRLQVVDPNGLYLFKNNGYAEIAYFSLTDNCVVGSVCDDGNACTQNDRFTENCDCVGEQILGCDGNIPCDFQVPIVVDKATEISETSFTANWLSETDCFDYLLLEVGRDSMYSGDVESFILEDITVISHVVSELDLSQGDYYYRLSGFQEEEQSGYSKNILVSLDRCKALVAEDMNYQCGTLDSTILNNSPLLTDLPVGSKVYASDWLVEVTKSSGTGSFTGKAKFTNDLFPEAQLNLVFKNIKVNEDCQMVDGFMEVEGFGLAIISPEISDILDGIIAGVDMALSAVEIYEQVINNINNILNETEGINDLLTDEWNLLDGTDPITDEYPYLDEEVTDAVQDAMDCFLQFNNMDSCTQQLIDALSDLQDAIESMYEADYQVKFDTTKHSLYGYDVYRYPGTELVYDQVLINDQVYNIPWISIDAAGGSEILEVESIGEVAGNMSTRIENNLEEIEIVGKYSGAFRGEDIELTGKEHEEKHQAYAYQEFGEDSVKIAGKVNIVSYDVIPLNVEIVAFNNATLPTGIDIEESLYNIFKSAMVNVSVTTQKVEQDIAVFQDTTGTSWYTNYTNEMKDVIDLIDAENDKQYIFLIPSHVDASKLGYNPRGKQYGFVFLGNHNSDESLVKTIAHELAHGKYRLQHPEKIFPDWGNAVTDLLMDDSPTGTHLTYYDWQQIHNPSGGFTLFDEDEEGELVAELNYEENSYSSSYYKVAYNPEFAGEYYFTQYNKLIRFTDLQENRIKSLYFDALSKKRLQGFDTWSNDRFIISRAIKHSDNDYIPTSEINFLCKDNIIDKVGIVIPPKTKPVERNEIEVNGEIKYTYKYVPADEELYRNKIQYSISCSEGIRYVKYNQGNVEIDTIINNDCNGGMGGIGLGEYVIDFSGRHMDEVEIEEARASLQSTQQETAVKARMYIIDEQTGVDTLEALQVHLDNLPIDGLAIVIRYDIDDKKYITYHFGNGQQFSEQNAIEKLVELQLEFQDWRLKKYARVLDGISFLMKSIQIPERFYNPSHTDYNNIFAKLKLGTVLVAPISAWPITDDAVNGLTNSTVEQCNVAFACGLYNEIINTAEGLVQFPCFLIKVWLDEEVKDKDGNGTGTTTREQLTQAYNGFVNDCAGDSLGVFSCGFVKVWEGIKKKHSVDSLGNSAMVYYNIGKDVTFLATFAVAFAKVGSLAKINLLLESLDVTTYIFRGAGLLLRYAVVQTKVVYKIGKAGTKLAISVAENSSTAIFKIIKNELEYAIDKSIQYLAPSSNLKWALASNDRLILGIDDMSGYDKIDDILDEASKKIEDAYGNYLVEIRKSTDSPSKSPQLVIAQKLKFGKWDELVEKHKNNSEITDFLNTFTSEQKVALEADLNNTLFRNWAMELEGVGGVKAWGAARNLPDEIKLNPDDLNIITDYMKRNPSKSVDDVAAEIPIENLTKSREWLGFRKLDDFLGSKPDVTLVQAPPGYQIYQVDNSKYIRRVNADDPYTPRLMVDGEDLIVPYVKPQRIAKNGKLRSNLENALGPAPPNHQAHHLISDNVVQKSNLYAEVLSRNKDGKVFYDIDRPSNGKFLAESAGDYKNAAGEWVSDSYKYPTHKGSHKAYDDAVTKKITDTEVRLKNEFGSLDEVPDDIMKLELELLEQEALLILEKWEPSRLN